MPDRTAYVDALHLLGRRELSEKELRDRLLDREHAREDVDRAIDLLIENKALDDGRVAAAYVRTAIKVKGRGRLRIQRELHERGIPKDVAAGDRRAFGEVDERALITKALQKKLRGNQKIATPAEYARVPVPHAPGVLPASVTAVLRTRRAAARSKISESHFR
jgi:regulatory protein